ncbi:MAG: peptidoglycan recognition protein family protein [Verrucomicrobiae bacterium]|nr:peptidoglycan recognition protein family protein [Verrucomicrobiae bacterium]
MKWRWVSVLATAVALLVSWGRADQPVPPARPWKYIVIHHSATAVGSAEKFAANHRARGMANGLAYHFVIDNGSDGMPDGFIEVGNRWTEQLPGGHCRTRRWNDTGIGICLVGDFTKDTPTERQLDSLVLLVRGLQEQFDIPLDHVVGHGQLEGESTECPGHRFPWDEFKARLSAER